MCVVSSSIFIIYKTSALLSSRYCGTCCTNQVPLVYLTSHTNTHRHTHKRTYAHRLLCPLHPNRRPVVRRACIAHARRDVKTCRRAPVRAFEIFSNCKSFPHIWVVIAVVEVAAVRIPHTHAKSTPVYMCTYTTLDVEIQIVAGLLLLLLLLLLCARPLSSGPRARAQTQCPGTENTTLHRCSHIAKSIHVQHLSSTVRAGSSTALASSTRFGVHTRVHIINEWVLYVHARTRARMDMPFAQPAPRRQIEKRYVQVVCVALSTGGRVGRGRGGQAGRPAGRRAGGRI